MTKNFFFLIHTLIVYFFWRFSTVKVACTLLEGKKKNTHSHCVFLRNFAKNMTYKVLINFCPFRAYGVYKNYSLPRALPLDYVFLGFQFMFFLVLTPSVCDHSPYPCGQRRIWLPLLYHLQVGAFLLLCPRGAVAIRRLRGGRNYLSNFKLPCETRVEER